MAASSLTSSISSSFHSRQALGELPGQNARWQHMSTFCPSRAASRISARIQSSCLWLAPPPNCTNLRLVPSKPSGLFLFCKQDGIVSKTT